MARNHARILTSIWNDADFLNLSAGAQRLYLMLLSQQNLSHAGLLPLTVKRWANKAKNTTVESVEAWLTELETARFVVVDEVTEELLIRSFIRGDEVYKQPNVMAAACTDANAIASHSLRTVLATEIARIRQIEGLVTRVVTALETLSEVLPSPSPNPSACPSENPPGATGTGKGTEVRKEPAPSPSPTPAPAPPPPAGSLALAAAEPGSAQTLIAEHIDACRRRPPDRVIGPLSRGVKELLAEGFTADDVRTGLTIVRDRGLHPSALASAVDQALNAKPRAPATSRNTQILDAAQQRAEAAERQQTHRRAIG